MSPHEWTRHETDRERVLAALGWRRVEVQDGYNYDGETPRYTWSWVNRQGHFLIKEDDVGESLFIELLNLSHPVLLG